MKVWIDTRTIPRLRAIRFPSGLYLKIFKIALFIQLVPDFILARKYTKIIYKITCSGCKTRNWSEGEGPMPDCVNCGAKLEKYKEKLAVDQQQE